ncbi:hypothetical protein GCM10027586_00370 [Kineococcus gypseus]
MDDPASRDVGVNGVVDAVRAAWRHLTGLHAHFAPSPAVRVLTTPASRLCPPSWCGIVTVAGATEANAPDAARAHVLKQVLNRSPSVQRLLHCLTTHVHCEACAPRRGTQMAHRAGCCAADVPTGA